MYQVFFRIRKIISALLLIITVFSSQVTVDATKTGEGRVNADVEFYNSEVKTSESKVTEVSKEKEENKDVKKKSTGILPKTGEELVRWIAICGGTIIILMIIIFTKKRKVGENND